MQRVAPLAGAWIETQLAEPTTAQNPVAPLAGAWIETYSAGSLMQSVAVAPLAGAWIETGTETGMLGDAYTSRPSRARGLKLRRAAGDVADWRRAPRGRVD